eukprot:SAG31_NODE_44_length_31168_cov_16.507290_16_plen_892_part_00
MGLAVVRQDGNLLQYCSDGLKNDEDVVCAAVTQFGQAMRFASSAMRTNRTIALHAVRQDGWALQYFDHELQGDRDVALAAVGQNAMSLAYCSDKLKRDRELVFQALKSGRGTALQYAHPTLRDDYDLVMTAVNSDGRALEWASKRLRSQKQIVEAAVSQSADALKYVDARQLQADGALQNLHELAISTKAACKIETLWRGRVARRKTHESMRHLHAQVAKQKSDAELKQLISEASSHSVRVDALLSSASSGGKEGDAMDGDARVRKRREWAERQRAHHQSVLCRRNEIETRLELHKQNQKRGKSWLIAEMSRSDHPRGDQLVRRQRVHRLELHEGLVQEWRVWIIVVMVGMSAARIQAHARGRRARLRRHKLLIWHKSTIIIQSWWRCAQAQKRLLDSAARLQRHRKIRTLIALLNVYKLSCSHVLNATRQALATLVKVKAALHIQAEWQRHASWRRELAAVHAADAKSAADQRFPDSHKHSHFKYHVSNSDATAQINPPPVYKVIKEDLEIDIDDILPSAEETWNGFKRSSHDPARAEERQLYRDLVVSLNNEGVAAIQAGEFEKGFACLHEAEQLLTVDGARLTDPLAARGDCDVDSTPALPTVEPALQQELKFMTYCNLARACTGGEVYGSRSTSASAKCKDNLNGENENRWRQAARWLRLALGDPIPPVDSHSCFALSSARAEHALILHQLGGLHSGKLNAQATAAVQLAQRGLQLAIKPQSKSVRAEIHHISTILCHAHRPYHAARLERLCTRPSTARRPRNGSAARRRLSSPAARQSSGPATTPPDNSAAQASSRARANGPTGIRSSGSTSRRSHRECAVTRRPNGTAIRPLSGPTTERRSSSRIGGTHRLTMPSRHTSLRSWLVKINATEAFAALRLCGYTSVS